MLFNFNTKKLKSQEEIKRDAKSTASSWQHTREEAAWSV